MEANLVRVTAPGEADALVAIRAVASGLAARAELSFQDIEDLCLAVNELALLSIGAGTGEIVLTFEVGDDALGCRTSFPPDFELDHDSMDTEVAMAILRAMVDDLTWEGSVLSFVKRNGSP